MGALTLGPLVLSLDRAYAGIGFLVLLAGAEVLARRGRPELATWAWSTALAVFLGARVGFVVSNLDFYRASPEQIVAIWQGGFAPWWGVAAGVLVSAWYGLRVPALRRSVAGLGVAALAAWWLPAALLTPVGGVADTRMPDLTLEDLAGHSLGLVDLATPAIVNVWATWCPPCRRELPVLFAAAERQADVAIVLVNQRESAALVRRYLEGAGFPTDGVLLDPTGAFGDALRVAGLPTTFAFDASGALVDVHVGEISSPALTAMIDRLR
jgi:cytochrome c biogenesis protein CcmG, thiol:disulfide interchange protein DsbE